MSQETQKPTPTEEKRNEETLGENGKESTKVQNELIGLEKQIENQNNQETINRLKAEIEISRLENFPLQTYNEIIKGTPLETKINNILSHPDFNNEKNYPELQGKTPEQRAEYLFRKINSAISRFYIRALGIDNNKTFPEYLYQVLVPATERFLIDILKQNGQSDNINLFQSINTLNLQNITQTFNDIRGLVDKFSFPYIQGKKLLQIIDFLALPQQQRKLTQLKNPYDFYQKLMQDPRWGSENLDIRQLNFEAFGIGENNPQLLAQELAEGKRHVQNEIGSIQMVESPDTLKKLIPALRQVDGFFLQTEKLSNKILDSMDNLGSIDSTLQSLGINLFDSVKDSKFLKGVFDFFLGILGFPGGISGLEKSWRKRKLERSLDHQKKSYITEVFKHYSEEKSITPETADTLITQLKLKVKDEHKALFALDMENIQSTMSANLQNTHHINPQVLEKITGKKFLEKIKDGSGKEVLQVKSDFFTSENKEKFISDYLATTLSSLSENEDFLKSVSNADDIAFTLIAGISLDPQEVVNGMKAEAIFPSDFYENQNTTSTNMNASESNQNNTEKYSGKILFSNKLGATEQEQEQNKAKIETVAKNLKINPNWLMAVIEKESSGTFSPSVSNKNSGAVGLIQFMPKTAQSLGTSTQELKDMSFCDQLNYVEKYFQGEKYNSFGDFYLKAFFPLGLKHTNNPDYVFKTDKLPASIIAKQNPAISKGKDEITMSDWNAYIAEIVKQNIPEEFKNEFS